MVQKLSAWNAQCDFEIFLSIFIAAFCFGDRILKRLYFSVYATGSTRTHDRRV